MRYLFIGQRSDGGTQETTQWRAGSEKPATILEDARLWALQHGCTLTHVGVEDNPARPDQFHVVYHHPYTPPAACPLPNPPGRFTVGQEASFRSLQRARALAELRAAGLALQREIANTRPQDRRPLQVKLARMSHDYNLGRLAG
jgi:hypothetical protein